MKPSTESQGLPTRMQRTRTWLWLGLGLVALVASLQASPGLQAQTSTPDPAGYTQVAAAPTSGQAVVGTASFGQPNRPGGHGDPTSAGHEHLLALEVEYESGTEDWSSPAPNRSVAIAWRLEPLANRVVSDRVLTLDRGHLVASARFGRAPPTRLS